MACGGGRSHALVIRAFERLVRLGYVAAAHKRHLANRAIRRMWKDESLRRDRSVHLAA